MTLDDHKVQQKQKFFSERFALDYVWPSLVMVSNAGTPEKIFLSENMIFQELNLSSVIFVKKSLKALRPSSKMVYQGLFYLLSWWTY